MTKRHADLLGCGLVQVIRVTWTKASRGGEGARSRNSVPSATEITVADLPDVNGSLCVDVSEWREHNQFVEPYHTYRKIPFASGFHFGCVTVSATMNGLQVDYQYDPGFVGAPDRRGFAPEGHRAAKPRRFFARDGEWIQVCHNGRFSDIDTGNWWYELVTVNVAFFAGGLDSRVFVTRRPSEELRVLAELW